MKEMSEVWDSLTDINQAGALELIAGQRQGNVVAGLLSNFAEAERASQISAEASGSAWRENEAYLDSINGKIGQFQAAFQGLSTSILDSGLVKYFIDLGTSITQAMQGTTEALGGPGWLVGGALGAFASYQDAGIFHVIDNPDTFSGKEISNIFRESGPTKTEISQIEQYNKNLKAIQESAGKSAEEVAKAKKNMANLISATDNTRMGDYLATLDSAPATLDGFSKGLKEVSVTSKLAGLGLQALSTATNMLLGMAVGAFINALINGLTWLAETEDRLIEKAQEANTTYSENTTSLESYQQQVESLQTSLSSGTLSYEENKQARQELLSIQSAMMEQFGKEASSADLVTQAINGQADAWQKLNDQQLEAWRLSVSQREWNGKTAADLAVEKMEKAIDIDGWMVGYTGDVEEYYRIIKQAQIDLLNEYSDFFEIDEARNAGHIGYLEAIEGPSAIEFERLDTAAMRDSYINKIREALSGKATNAEIGEIEEAAVQSLDTMLATLQENANAIISEYGETYDTLGYSEIRDSAGLSNILDTFIAAEDAYEEAFISGDEADVDAAANTFKTALSNLRSAINSDNTPEVVKDYFRDLIDASSMASEIDKIDFIDDLASKFKSQLKEFEGLDEINIYDALLGKGDTEEVKNAFDEILDFAQDESFIPDESADSISRVIDLLVELGYVSGNTSDNVAKLSLTFADLKSSMEAAQAEAATVTEVLNSQSTGTGITLENYEALIAVNEDYADALEYTNGVMTINAEKAREIADTDIIAQIAKAKLAMQDEARQYIENMETIKEYKSRLDSLYDSQGNFIGENESAADALRQQIDSLYDSSEAIQNNIDKYAILVSSLREATGAYQLWQDAQSAPESGDMYDDTSSALKQISEGLESGKVGTQKFQTAIDFLIPDDVDSEDIAKIEEYKNNVLSRYLTFDEDSGETLVTGVSNFTQDAIEAGLAEIDEDGVWKVAAEKTMQDFAEALHLSPEVVQAIFGELEEYGGKFEWSDEFEQSLKLSVEELEAYLQDLPEAEIKANIDSIQEAESQLYDLVNGDLGEVTAEIPVNVKAQLQVQQTKTELEARLRQLKSELAATQDPDEQGIIYNEIVRVTEELEKYTTIRTELEPPSQEDIEAAKEAIRQQRLTLQAELDAELNLNVNEQDPEKIENLRSQISSLGQMDAQIDILSNSANWEEGKTEVDADKADLENNPATVDITANNSDALWKIGNVRSSLSALDGRTATVTIRTNNVNTVTTRYNTVGNPGGARKQSGEQSVANGTAHAEGTALASGDWGTDKRERTLVGELGRELVVDPHTGKWHTVGDFGPEFVDLPKDSIVFNHKQTEELLKKGYAIGRGAAMASGNAMVTGGLPILNIQVGAGNATWSGGWGGNWSNSTSEVTNQVNQATSATNNLNDAVENTSNAVSDAADEVEEYVSELWELYEVETALEDIQSDTEILEIKLGLAQNVAEETNLREQIIDQYEAEQEALHNLAEARRELMRQDIDKLTEMGFEISYDPDYNKLFIANTEHINDLVGEVSGTFETAEDRENALQEATNDLRKETEDMINSLIDMNDANQDASQSWWELLQSIQDVKEEMSESVIGIFDDYIDYMDAFELWADSSEDRVEALKRRQEELNRLYAEGYLTIQQYKDLTFDNQKEVYEAQRDAIIDIIELTEQMIEQEVRDKIDAIEKQIEAYRELIEIRKEALEENRDEEDHQDELNEKLEEMARLRQQIDRLDLAAQTGDRAAAAEKVSLEEQYYELQKDLAQLQGNYVYDAQQEALDKELEAFEDQKNEEIRILEESIDTQVKLYNLAIERINQGWDALYQDLIAYNRVYGDGISGDDSIKTAWDMATEAVKNYAYNVEAALEGIKNQGSISNIFGNQANDIISQMKANSDAWHTASDSEKAQLEAINERLAQQLSALLGRPVVKDPGPGVWYLDQIGGEKLFDSPPSSITGTTGGSGSASQEQQNNSDLAKVKSLVKEMRVNSSRWHSALSDDERAYYENQNKKIASQVSAILGRKLVIGGDGVWYLDRLGGNRLFDIYHKGGVVGGNVTSGDNEVFALLEKGEYVLNEKQQSALAKLVSLGKTLAGETKDRLVSSVSPVMSETGGDTFNADFEVNFNVNDGLSESEMKRYGETFANMAIKKLQSAFTRSGISNNKIAFGKA